MSVAFLLSALGLLSPGHAQSDAEKMAADWLYPKAKTTTSGRGGTVYCIVQDTADDMDAIRKHYSDKVGVEFPTKGIVSGSRGGTQVQTVEFTAHGHGAAGHVATFKTSAACVTVVIHPARHGNTVTVSYVPLTSAK
jgi:hypothetical protein